MDADTLKRAAEAAHAEADRLESASCPSMAALFERTWEGWPSYRHTSIGRLVAEVARDYLDGA